MGAAVALAFHRTGLAASARGEERSAALRYLPREGVGRSPGTERCGGGAEGRISVCFGKLETGLSRGWHESRLTPSCITNHVEKAASAASRVRELRPAEQGLPFSLRNEPPSANPRRAAPQHRSAAHPPAAAPRRPCQPARDARGGAAGPAGRGGAARCSSLLSRKWEITL